MKGKIQRDCRTAADGNSLLRQENSWSKIRCRLSELRNQPLTLEKENETRELHQPLMMIILNPTQNLLTSNDDSSKLNPEAVEEILVPLRPIYVDCEYQPTLSF